jgi:hypothetical protein
MGRRNEEGKITSRYPQSRGILPHPSRVKPCLGKVRSSSLGRSASRLRPRPSPQEIPPGQPFSLADRSPFHLAMSQQDLLPDPPSTLQCPSKISFRKAFTLANERAGGGRETTSPAFFPGNTPTFPSGRQPWARLSQGHRFHRRFDFLNRRASQGLPAVGATERLSRRAQDFAISTPWRAEAKGPERELETPWIQIK